MGFRAGVRAISRLDHSFELSFRESKATVHRSLHAESQLRRDVVARVVTGRRASMKRETLHLAERVVLLLLGAPPPLADCDA